MLDDVTGNGDELSRVCAWVRQAWEELRLYREDWQWKGKLSKKNDVPSMPERFHMAIVYLALQKYAAYEAAPEVYAYALDRFNFYLSRIERDQIGQIELGGALA